MPFCPLVMNDDKGRQAGRHQYYLPSGPSPGGQRDSSNGFVFKALVGLLVMATG